MYDGRNKSRPLLLAIKGRVLDVSTGEEFYGVDGPYHKMAGRDARFDMRFQVSHQYFCMHAPVL